MEKFRYLPRPVDAARGHHCACGASRNRIYHTDKLIHTPEECYEAVAV